MKRSDVMKLRVEDFEREVLKPLRKRGIFFNTGDPRFGRPNTGYGWEGPGYRGGVVCIKGALATMGSKAFTQKQLDALEIGFEGWHLSLFGAYRFAFNARNGAAIMKNPYLKHLVNLGDQIFNRYVKET